MNSSRCMNWVKLFESAFVQNIAKICSFDLKFCITHGKNKMVKLGVITQPPPNKLLTHSIEIKRNGNYTWLSHLCLQRIIINIELFAQNSFESAITKKYRKSHFHVVSMRMPKSVFMLKNIYIDELLINSFWVAKYVTINRTEYVFISEHGKWKSCTKDKTEKWIEEEKEEERIRSKW